LTKGQTPARRDKLYYIIMNFEGFLYPGARIADPQGVTIRLIHDRE